MSGTDTPPVVVEGPVQGRPHAGRTLAVVTPHLDDMPIFASGTVAKLLAEGYRGYLIRTSNDEVDSVGLTVGETVAANERDTREVARVLGLDGVFDLNERNHRMDETSRLEMRARLIFLFRLLRVDTVFSYDPWGHDEENPDHYVTAQAVEAACWMAGNHLDYAEHFAAGLEPHAVREKYYFSRRRQDVNRAVDISTLIDRKMDAICACRTQMAHTVSDLRAYVVSRGMQAAGLEGDTEAAIRFYAEEIHRRHAATVGATHGLAYAEEFHWIGPESPQPGVEDPLAAFIARHAQPTKG
jgi:LmbE family N-acetylglucosaminyl deacetylase